MTRARCVHAVLLAPGSVFSLKKHGISRRRKKSQLLEGFFRIARTRTPGSAGGNKEDLQLRVVMPLVSRC